MAVVETPVTPEPAQAETGNHDSGHDTDTTDSGGDPDAADTAYGADATDRAYATDTSDSADTTDTTDTGPGGDARPTDDRGLGVGRAAWVAQAVGDGHGGGGAENGDHGARGRQRT
ncbi:hypothetical protein [Streptomyces fuscichromogenes]|uniref:Uncharacterized protein n=1 Tax=Streptomyces fuscichromogenes TaxID=1324013 RepID=A0A917XNA6_9ACTN|nr:hypothetical protein [Streptomyces fuscichromogenes]GGN39644.1 hypothetical protein GCM10011578_086490 [Streptomyces fuscichromogenes]